MNENLKFRRDTIFKVLAWATFVHLIVWGYSLTQSNLFELKHCIEKQCPKEAKGDQPEACLREAQYNQAAQLESEAATADNSNTANSNPAEKRVKAAQIRLDAYLAKEVENDRCRRAVGLISGAFFYALIYPVVVWLVYQRTDLGTKATEKDVFSLKLALLYAIVMSLATFCTAFLTAYY